MPLEEEMQTEIRKLEREIGLIDDELEKLHKKLLHYILLRKKKEHEVRVLRGDDIALDKEIQTTLQRLMKEKI